MSIMERCPACGALGRIDEDQAQGKVSIQCSECGNHYYKEEGLTFQGGM